MFKKSICPSKLKGHQFAKELGEQLKWSLENDLKNYCKDKDIELDFNDTLPCGIDVEIKESSDLINKIINEEIIDVFDLEIMWIEYQDYLWTVLHYNEEIKEAYKRIDNVCKILDKYRKK